ncbi:hypothetical protein ACHAQJ_008298 [Trichoderma viride]
MGPRESGQAASDQANAHASTKLTEKEAREIAEYEKILRFRDSVLSGKHPTIKFKEDVNTLPNPISSTARSPSEPGEVDTRPQALQSFSASTQNQNPILPQRLADAGTKAYDPKHPKPFGAGTTEINPIFLEKSDQLVRAEFQLQRQRLERSLREEIEQHRVLRHAEPVIEFDLSDVLAKALTLVQAAATPFAANRGLTANSASDSFDDNTFYSSQHETPESHLTSRVRRSTDEVMMIDNPRQLQSRPHESTNSGSHVAPSVRNYPVAGPSSQPSFQAPAPIANATVSRPEKQQVPSLVHIHANRGNPTVTTHGLATATRTEPDRSAETGHQRPETSGPQFDRNQPVQPLPPLIRNHDLIPVAPQPAKIAAPLPVVNVQTPAVDSALAASLAAPSQVAALRNEAPAVAISDDSSQGAKDADQRKGKRKKRKVDRQAPEAETSPRIKVEPRSQSPVTAPAYTRPSKRQRQSQGHANEYERPEPRYAQPPPNTSYERQPLQVYRGEPAPIAYQAPNRAPYLSHSASNSTLAAEPVTASNYSRDFADDRRVSGEGFIRPPPPGESYVRRDLSRDMAPYHHPPPREIHGSGAVSQVITYDPYREPVRIYREPLEAPRASARPEGESFIIPPRPPTRVMVDSYGREYVEPVLPSARQSVAPLPRSGEPEVIYERLPPRPLSSHPGPGAPYNEGSMVYARPLSVYDPVNRVYVSQPEYPYDHRDGQYREHQLQQRGYIQLVGPHDRRIVEERPAEYVSRGVGHRPSDRMRLEPTTHQPYVRMHSLHPEAPGRESTGNVHIDGRHPEGPQPYVREYVGSPMQHTPTVHREYSVRPSERYQGPPAPTRGSDEIAFIERPRGATREIVYVDDVRREVYR